LKITASGVTRGEWVLWVNGNGLIKRRCAVDVYEAIYTRKSVRAFKDKDIPEIQEKVYGHLRIRIYLKKRLFASLRQHGLHLPQATGRNGVS
jgi:hypothetical protein